MQHGKSYTKGDKWDMGKYEVVRLPDGKNPLTGSIDKYELFSIHEKCFTCVELEVFALE